MHIVHVVVIFMYVFKLTYLCDHVNETHVTYIVSYCHFVFCRRRIILLVSFFKPKGYITFVRSLFCRRAPIWQID